MSFLRSFDDATRSSMRAVILCVAGSLLGLFLAFVIATWTSAGHLPVGTFLVSIFVLLTGNLLLRRGQLAYDPSTTFVTYLLTLCSSVWIIEFFFRNPDLGPFAAELWTVPNVLTNAAFGIILFLLIGMTLGMTYFAARRTHGEFTTRRALFTFIGLGVPIYCLAQTEYFLANFHL